MLYVIVMESRNGGLNGERKGTLRLLELAVTASPGGVVITDATRPDNPIVYVNPAFERITGYASREVVGRNPRFMQGPDRDQPEVMRELRRAVEEGREFLGVLRNHKKDGTPYWNELRIAPVRDEEGRLTNFVGVQNDVTERVRAKEELARLASFPELNPNPVIEIRPDGELTYANPAAEKLFRGVKTAGLGHPLLVELGPSIAELRSGRARSRTHEVDAGDWCYQLEASMIAESGRARIYATDVTERKKVEKRLREVEERYRVLVEQVPAVIYIDDVDETNSAIYRSPHVEEMLGYALEEFAADPELWQKLLHPDDRERVLVENERTNETGEPFVLEYRMIHRDGHVVWVRDEAVLVADAEGRPRFWQGVMSNITERKELEERLSHQALHDSLTGLPNRTLFVDRLGQALNRAGRRGARVAVLFLDLDNFKYVNDSLGHEAGDELLVEVANRLRSLLRPEDALARLGGDEFVLLLEDVGSEDQVVKVAERIEMGLRAPFALDGHEFFVTASTGIAFGGDAGDRPDDLLRDSDTAMYQAKESGKDHHAVFSPEMKEHSSRRLGLEGDLRRALRRPEREFRVHYQPKALVKTAEIVGVEALVRWEHPERGLVLPSDFVPLAEETGLIVPLGRWVLREACRQAKEWQEGRPAGSSLFMSVNLSARQFRDPDLAGEIEDVLAETGLDPGSLVLEITESVLMEDAPSTVAILERLKAFGVRVAIDDFGTGYSSLSYLKRFPVDVIKIDRSIVSGLERDPGNAAIVSATITLAHALDLEVVAEGVETEGEVAELHNLGCDLGQGYYWWRPRPAKETTALLKANLHSLKARTSESRRSRRPAYRLPPGRSAR